MAEYTNSTLQTVLTGQNIQFSDTAVRGQACIMHREGSGVVTLKGLTNQCRACFKISFGANIAVPTGGTVGAISVSLAISGEPLESSRAIVTPAAVGDFFNVYISTFIYVPKGCCLTVSAENTSTQTINVQNANLIIERVS